jgi:hypothetical protein
MTKIFAVREDNQERMLIAIKCESCGVEIKPVPSLEAVGWTKLVQRIGTEKFVWHYCEDCGDPSMRHR